MSLAPDTIEISCAHCLSRMDAMAVPIEAFPCGVCGAILEPVVVHVVHHVSTVLKALPTDYQDDDPTPVQTPIPLRAIREARLRDEKG
jgi:hypothetical protein